MKIYNAVVITTLLYASECWTLLANDLMKLEVFQMSYGPATELHDTAPLQGTTHHWEVG